MSVIGPVEGVSSNEALGEQLLSGTSIVFSAYLVVLLALALWSRRETRTLDGYFLAGKKLPSWVVAFSTNATGESGGLLLGLARSDPDHGENNTSTPFVRLKPDPHGPLGSRYQDWK